MPYDKEIQFGFVGTDKVFDAISRFGYTAKTSKKKSTVLTKEEFVRTGVNFDVDETSSVSKTLDISLRTSFINTIVAFGWKYGEIANTLLAGDKSYIGVVSPWGNRAARIWSLGIQYDPFECGDTPDLVTFGVNLSSRYFPSILDMKDEHGGLGNVIPFDSNLFHAIELCKTELIKEIPELFDAVIYFREIFY